MFKNQRSKFNSSRHKIGMIMLFTIDQQFFRFVPLFFVLLGLVILGSIALWVFLCVWVYRDANQRGMDGSIWLIIVIFTHIIGVIIYLIVRKPETVIRTVIPVTASRYCIYCGNPLSEDAIFCSRCGKAAQSQ